MNYTVEIEINLPLERVISLFGKADNIRLWQPDLVSFESVSGTPGEVGAESKLVYKMGSREIEMTEVITQKNLPLISAGIYETDNVWNLVENSFISLGKDKTKWISKNEFKCTGFVKMMAMLMPGTFKKQSSQYLQNFKQFAEGLS